MRIIAVFVPLSGLTSVNALGVGCIKRTEEFLVSVPLSGLTSVNKTTEGTNDGEIFEFSSPYRG